MNRFFNFQKGFNSKQKIYIIYTHNTKHNVYIYIRKQMINRLNKLKLKIFSRVMWALCDQFISFIEYFFLVSVRYIQSF